MNYGFILHYRKNFGFSYTIGDALRKLVFLVSYTALLLYMRNKA